LTLRQESQAQTLSRAAKLADEEGHAPSVTELTAPIEQYIQHGKAIIRTAKSRQSSLLID
jgi:hypothetical protein